MIPNVIHYCWFGRNPKPPVVQACIDSWKKFLPGWEIREWNEDTFDVTQIPFSRDAYEAKMWAFVSDFARLKIIHDMGGVYLDTDVLLNSDHLKELCVYDCWLACDTVWHVATGLGFGAAPGNAIIGALAEGYRTLPFDTKQTNTQRDTSILDSLFPEWKRSEHSVVLSGNLCIVGVRDYGHYGRHLGTAMWDGITSRAQDMDIISKGITPREFRIWKLKCFLRKPVFYQAFKKLSRFKGDKVYLFLVYDLLDCGPRYFIRRTFRKLFLRHS